ncbi:hypothetical protein ACFP9V_18545 [Deinococcus radiopugnans]|uniref:Uncharacterized protein n=1 Tax=Deinococcus radiopugnans ATCC 19172 TaxID=585398 RepID=A0ABR6NX09_9DEIO|nr:hypothetical protein [Deinococcus radiopugnans]MBB6017441.1 hypothetical protein [Deinococcus radiopugnans ATCC 19172]
MTHLPGSPAGALALLHGREQDLRQLPKRPALCLSAALIGQVTV